MKLYLTVFLILSGLINIFAQFPPVTLTNTEIRSLHSEINDSDYELYIKLPYNYSKSDIKYPVLFTTDANRTFAIYSTVSQVYETPIYGNKGIIIVGIGYPVSENPLEGLADWVVRRRYDFTPDRDVESEKVWSERLTKIMGKKYEVIDGGAEEFLNFINKELIPFIENNYRVSNERGLAGYSLGGLFSIYALLKSPQTFSKYFAGSPSEYDKWLKYAEDMSDVNNGFDAKVVMTANGTEQKTWEGIQQLTEILKRHYPNININSYFYEDENHVSGGAGAASKALYLLYYNE